LKPSLSVLLSVRNEQSRLADWVTTHLEVLPELTPRFELVIVDLGSTDATPEVADELALGYPQISILTQPSRLDAAGALRMGLAHTTGDLVFVCGGLGSDAHDLPKLWNAAERADAVVARMQSFAAMPGRPLVESTAPPEMLLFHRRVATAWHGALVAETLLSYLIRKRYRIAQLALRPAARKETPAPARPVVPKPKLASSGGNSSALPRPHRAVTRQPGRVM
jgi:glycosyltransferase involved in cell wall biosynthesis